MSNKEKLKIFLTGGTGSFGKAFISKCLDDVRVDKIIVFSRDELKQFELRGHVSSPKVDFILGDVRDRNRVTEASKGCNLVIHAAAMKQIVAAEDNPLEAIKTNINGAENIIEAAIHNKISKVIALSTDKAANPANLYGATKLCSDKLMVAANFLPNNQTTRFSVVRYGNVVGSRGSVIPFFKEHVALGYLPITDDKMTRFWITLTEGVGFVLQTIDEMEGGEIFVPKIPSFKIIDVASIIAPNTPIRIIGIRPGEKLHEVMVTEDDSLNTIEMDDFYVIIPPKLIQSSKFSSKGSKVPFGFKFSSDTNKKWYNQETFKKMLKDNYLI
jgi:UDP-N-acetylglucosamine 4,6-dehydratase